MASTTSGIEYPVAGDFIAPLNAHLQTLAETTQAALDARAPQTSTTYTPTFTGLTLGNGTISAVYTKTGNVIVDKITITFGSTTAVTGDVVISDLQTAAYTANGTVCGNALLHDSGTAYYKGSVRQASATSVQVLAESAGGSYVLLTGLTSAIPHTWAIADQIIISTVRLVA
jgi:hypothetical protein